MRTHRVIQNSLFSYVKQELAPEDREAIELHLQSCESCSRKLQDLRSILGLLSENVKRPSDHRSEMYWQQFAEKVERRIQGGRFEEPAQSFIGRLLDSIVENRKPFGVGFASALSMIALAFAVWSLWIKTPEDKSVVSGKGGTELTANIQRSAMEVRADEYLEQSKVLLIGILNTDPQSMAGSKPLLERQRNESKKLVRESEEISAGLTDPSQLRLKELVSDLGVILLQIANLESKHSMQGVEIVKSGVERNGILFKINLEEIHRTQRSSEKKVDGKSAKSTL